MNSEPGSAAQRHQRGDDVADSPGDTPAARRGFKRFVVEGSSAGNAWFRRSGRRRSDGAGFRGRELRTAKITDRLARLRLASAYRTRDSLRRPGRARFRHGGRSARPAQGDQRASVRVAKPLAVGESLVALRTGFHVVTFSRARLWLVRSNCEQNDIHAGGARPSTPPAASMAGAASVEPARQTDSRPSPATATARSRGLATESRSPISRRGRGLAADRH